MLKLSLAQPTEPFWIDLVLPGGSCRLQLRPLTLEVNSAIGAYASRLGAAAIKERLDRLAEGAPIDDLPDFTDPDIRNGHIAAVTAIALARFGIVAWEGVLNEDTGEPWPVTPETAEAFARVAGARFVDAYQAGLAALDAEGNASGAAPNGGSAHSPTTAPPASQAH